MSQPKQEQAARRFQSFDTENIPPGYDADYECELPADARAELTRPKRPRILGRRLPVGTPPPRGPYYLVWFCCALALAGLAISLWRQVGVRERTANQAISQPALTPQLQPSPTPAATPLPLPAGSASRWKEYLANNPPAPRATLVQRIPRATLVQLPPPRAELVRVPEWQIGETRPVMMPYNLEVLSTYKGELAGEWLLPQSGNQLGDMWLVANTPWIWLVTPGTTVPQWVDP